MVKGSWTNGVVVHDTSEAFTRRPQSHLLSERRNFLSHNIKDMYERPARKSTDDLVSEYKDMDMKQMLKEVKCLGSSHMSWKEKKKMENHEIVALGGKPPKKCRVAPTLARCIMKKQKEREQKKLEEGLILEQFGPYGSSKKRMEKRKVEDEGLKASEGHFKNGILNLKNLFSTSSSSRNDNDHHKARKGKKRKGNGKKKGKKKN